MNHKQYELVVIGGGPAGIAGAVEAFKNGVKHIVIIEREEELGGILKQCIHNGFGLHVFKEELTGPEYAYRWIQELKNTTIEVLSNTTVLSINDKKELAVVNTSGIIMIQADNILLAMGCRERTRGAIMTPGTRAAGIYSAGCAQKLVNMEGYMPGEAVVVVGSGDIGLIMARRMSLEGASVKLVIEIMPYSSGLARNIVQCVEDFNIPLKFNTTITKIHGKERVEGITIAQVDESRNVIESTEEFIRCDTILFSVGLVPENELSKKIGLQLDPLTNGPIVNEDLETSISGVYACGNVVHVHDLVDHVTLEAQRAGVAIANKTKDSLPAPIIIKYSKQIRYVVPQKINSLCHPELVFSFRSSNVYRNVTIQFISNHEVIHQLKKPILTPGEMNTVILPKGVLDKIQGDLKIEVSEVNI